jgi:hypothetical protein
LRFVAGLTLALLCAACGRDASHRDCYPVRGRVLIKGQPAASALVVFYPVDRADGKSPSASATTEDDGTFILSTYETEDGAPAGDYDVAITPAGKSSPVTRDPFRKLAGKKQAPERSRAKAQTFRVHIEARANDLPAFELP